MIQLNKNKNMMRRNKITLNELKNIIRKVILEQMQPLTREQIKILGKNLNILIQFDRKLNSVKQGIAAEVNHLLNPPTKNKFSLSGIFTNYQQQSLKALRKYLSLLDLLYDQCNKTKEMSIMFFKNSDVVDILFKSLNVDKKREMKKILEKLPNQFEGLCIDVMAARQNIFQLLSYHDPKSSNYDDPKELKDKFMYDIVFSYGTSMPLFNLSTKEVDLLYLIINEIIGLDFFQSDLLEKRNRKVNKNFR